MTSDLVHILGSHYNLMRINFIWINLMLVKLILIKFNLVWTQSDLIHIFLS